MEPYLIEMFEKMLVIPGVFMTLFCIAKPLRRFYDCTQSPCLPRYTAETALEVIPRLMFGIIALVSVSSILNSLLSQLASSSFIIGIMVGLIITIGFHIVLFVRTIHQ